MMVINILGVIYTLQMSVDGNIVDHAKCAACYACFGSTDGQLDTYHSFFFFTLVNLLFFQISSLRISSRSLSNSKARQ